MKIAVASTDGVTVASSLSSARGFLVFEVTGNEVGSANGRKRGRQGWARRTTPLIHIHESRESRLLTAEGADAGVPEDLLQEMLDCEAVVAGKFGATEQEDLRRLGILILAALPGETAEATVRFIVSGSPPREGEVCGLCPKRQGAL